MQTSFFPAEHDALCVRIKRADLLARSSLLHGSQGTIILHRIHGTEEAYGVRHVMVAGNGQKFSRLAILVLDHKPLTILRHEYVPALRCRHGSLILGAFHPVGDVTGRNDKVYPAYGLSRHDAAIGRKSQSGKLVDGLDESRVDFCCRNLLFSSKCLSGDAVMLIRGINYLNDLRIRIHIPSRRERQSQQHCGNNAPTSTMFVTDKHKTSL